MEKEIHKVQASILKELVFNNGTNFASLNKTDLTNDHFTFHINQLVKRGVVVKEKEKYYLTQKGKTLAAKFDIDTLKIVKQAKLGVLVAPIMTENGKTKYLIQKRLKEPQYGFYGFITGKIRYGEKSKDTATRELFEESGIVAEEIQFMGIDHGLGYNKKKEVVSDIFFFIYKVTKFSGNLINTPEGNNSWKTF